MKNGNNNDTRVDRIPEQGEVPIVKQPTFLSREKRIPIVTGIALLGLIAVLVCGFQADARSATPARSRRTPRATAAKPQPKPAPTPRNADTSSICIEAATGLVISEEDADIQRPPASMVKMIMMLMVAEGIHAGKWTLETPITVTSHGQGMGGTQVYLKEGETFPLSQLLAAVAVHSANDAAMAIAEGLWGNEDAYKKAANDRAAELGMTNTLFRSVHGLPPAKGELPDQTTARDMARLGQFCVLDPMILQWTSQKELKFRPESAVEYNTNKLLWQMEGCDGIKTGYTRGAGFCLTATAVRDGIRLIAVVMGADDKKDRFALTHQLLEDGFRKVCKKQLLKKGDAIGSPVSVINCETARMQLVSADDFTIVITKDDADKLVVAPQLPEWIQPPVKEGSPLGEAVVQLNDKPLAHVPAVASKDLAEAGWRWRLLQSIVPAKDNTPK